MKTKKNKKIRKSRTKATNHSANPKPKRKGLKNPRITLNLVKALLIAHTACTTCPQNTYKANHGGCAGCHLLIPHCSSCTYEGICLSCGFTYKLKNTTTTQGSFYQTCDDNSFVNQLFFILLVAGGSVVLGVIIGCTVVLLSKMYKDEKRRIVPIRIKLPRLKRMRTRHRSLEPMKSVRMDSEVNEDSDAQLNGDPGKVLQTGGVDLAGLDPMPHSGREAKFLSVKGIDDPDRRFTASPGRLPPLKKGMGKRISSFLELPNQRTKMEDIKEIAMKSHFGRGVIDAREDTKENASLKSLKNRRNLRRNMTIGPIRTPRHFRSNSDEGDFEAIQISEESVGKGGGIERMNYEDYDSSLSGPNPVYMS